MFEKDIFGNVKFLEKRRRFPLETFFQEIIIPLPFFASFFHLLVVFDGGIGVGTSCTIASNGGMGGVCDLGDSMPSLLLLLLTSV